MSERTTELPSEDAVTQSANLYDTELRAQDTLEDHLTWGGSEEEEGDGGEQAGEAAQSAQEDRDHAVKQSNDFTANNMDALHDAAIQEAAQRVADAYEAADTPDTREQPNP